MNPNRKKHGLVKVYVVDDVWDGLPIGVFDNVKQVMAFLNCCRTSVFNSITLLRPIYGKFQVEEVLLDNDDEL